MLQIADHPQIRAAERTGYPEPLAQAAGLVAREAAEALRRIAREGRLAEETKTARELCGVMKDALAVERELRAEEKSAVVTVRFEGGTEDAAE